ncbi:unnamed protein product [Euphydryas editha]|uniref:Uncharacterized protein n=1 Tax=Euphydryas editha TaxID=104508 RepID=A0AAU9V0W6_EUPED|nr:unnamed protein product [Euphydryas editha]
MVRVVSCHLDSVHEWGHLVRTAPARPRRRAHMCAACARMCMCVHVRTIACTRVLRATHVRDVRPHTLAASIQDDSPYIYITVTQ